MMEMLLDILLDTLIDAIKILPFLFVTYLLMEFLEHHTQDKVSDVVEKAGHFGPLLGGLFGAIPQCGFSAAASNLYAGRVISLGTLMAIYLSTSDEMIPLMISEHAPADVMLKILAMKAVIGILAGFVIDLVLHTFHRRKGQPEEEMCIDKLCEKEHCHCEEEEESILKSALVHTLHIFYFVILFTLLLNGAVAIIGESTIAGFLQSNAMISHLLAGILGLIPNCAPSIILTELYLGGMISLGSMMSGLLVGAGVGLLVLYRVNDNRKENIRITVLLYVVGLLFGILIDLLGIVF